MSEAWNAYAYFHRLLSDAMTHGDNVTLDNVDIKNLLLLLEHLSRAAEERDAPRYATGFDAPA